MRYLQGPGIAIPHIDGSGFETVPTAVDSSDASMQPVPISRDVRDATFDMDYRRRQPFLSGRNRLGADTRNDMSPEDSLGYGVGQALRRGIDSAYRTDGRALLTNGLGGAALGLGGLYAFNKLRGNRPGWKSRVATALLGAAAGGALTVQMRGGSLPRTTMERYKVSSAPWQDMGSLRADIMRAASSLDSATRERVQGALVRLGPGDLERLHRVATTLVGAAAGAAVARWLVGKGLIPALVGATIGGLAGRAFGAPATNAFGRPALSNYR